MPILVQCSWGCRYGLGMVILTMPPAKDLAADELKEEVDTVWSWKLAAEEAQLRDRVIIRARVRATGLGPGIVHHVYCNQLSPAGYNREAQPYLNTEEESTPQGAIWVAPTSGLDLHNSYRAD